MQMKIGVDFLHVHLDLQRNLKLDEHHVIVDKEDWERAVKLLLEMQTAGTPIESTSNHPHYANSGRTTRIVDAAIQKLFKSGKATIHDHFQSHAKARPDHAFMTFLKRIETEHNWMYNAEYIQVDSRAQTVILTDKAKTMLKATRRG